MPSGSPKADYSRQEEFDTLWSFLRIYDQPHDNEIAIRQRYRAFISAVTIEAGKPFQHIRPPCCLWRSHHTVSPCQLQRMEINFTTRANAPTHPPLQLTPHEFRMPSPVRFIKVTGWHNDLKL